MMARPVELFHFHNLTLTVVEADAVHFVALKPVVEMLGITWRRAREHVLEAENTALFGIKTLNPTPTDDRLIARILVLWQREAFGADSAPCASSSAQ